MAALHMLRESGKVLLYRLTSSIVTSYRQKAKTSRHWLHGRSRSWHERHKKGFLLQIVVSTRYPDSKLSYEAFAPHGIQVLRANHSSPVEPVGNGRNIPYGICFVIYVHALAHLKIRKWQEIGKKREGKERRYESGIYS